MGSRPARFIIAASCCEAPCHMPNPSIWKHLHDQKTNVHKMEEAKLTLLAINRSAIDPTGRRLRSSKHVDSFPAFFTFAPASSSFPSQTESQNGFPPQKKVQYNIVHSSEAASTHPSCQISSTPSARSLPLPLPLQPVDRRGPA